MEVSRLENRDYTLLIDKSGSMAHGDVPNFKSRWDAVKETTQAIANKLHSLDPDGITLYTFGSNFKRYDNVTPDAVDRVFNENEPMGSTALHLALQDVADKFKARKAKGETKNGETVVVVTDGAPDNQQAVANVISNTTKWLEHDKELVFTFFQIGQDPGARAFLKRLDDDLQREGAKFDIVDTKTFTELEGMTLTEALIAAMDD